MLKYRKVINNETHECEVGLGTDEDFYKSLGMELGEVEQTFDGRWYELGFVPEPPLVDLKLAKREEINRARDAAEQGGFSYLGKTFDSDTVSCLRISCAAQSMELAPSSSTITWTCQDNSTIDLTPTDLKGLVATLAMHSNTCHEKATALKEKIEAAQTAEELAAITWDSL